MWGEVARKNNIKVAVIVFLPELGEREATGEKAAVYGEMKRLGAVPMVALIFRHLATLPGALEWTWAAIGPAWKSGRLQEEAWRIARSAPLEPLAPIPREALAPLGVDAAGLREIRVVLDATTSPSEKCCRFRRAGLLEGAQPRNRSRLALEPPPAPGRVPIPGRHQRATWRRCAT